MNKTIILILLATLLIGGGVYAAEVATPVPVPGERVTAKQILDAQSWGFKLYDDGEFEEALPYLDAAARMGLKEAQARLGGMYLYGKGTKRNDLVGISWLGVAARGESTATIQEIFGTVWEKVPENAIPQLTEYIDTFEAEFGELKIECEKSRQAGSHIATEVCSFGEKWDTLREVELELQNQAGIGTRRGDGEITVDGFTGGP